MQEKTVRRYSDNFKRQVINELESGRFSSIEQARIHYEIGNCVTIQRWLKEYGKNHLLPKVIRVEQVDEADRIQELKKQISELVVPEKVFARL